MSIHQRNFSKILLFNIRFFFRKYPALPYVLKWLCISLIIGALVGSASAGFLISLTWATDFREQHLWLIWLLPFAGLAVGLLYHYWGKDVEAGNNLLLSTLNNPEGTIPLKMAPFVYLGTLMTHLFGGSAGREGTALQMAGAIADQLAKPFRLNRNERKTLLTAAIAAGFGSVFGTPLAGAVFALEILFIGKIRYHAIFPVFASAILASIMTDLWGAQHTHYPIGKIPSPGFLPVVYSIIAGMLFGICAATFSKLLHRISAVFRAKINYPPLRPLIGGIIIAAAVFSLGTTRYIGLGIPVITESFEHRLPVDDFALKIAFTIITLAAGFKGGEVTPLFFTGAALGSALSLFIPLPFGLLAGMGFVAVFAGATNTPLACILMGMELFGAECGIYVAVACVVSYLFSGHNSIYSQQKIGSEKNSRYRSDRDKSFSDL
ncbi:MULTISPECIES: voltage-gated chloride channel family protein [Chryseobacterium]|uniref:H+/Cl- antiporter ClcA n=1 Tax=Chryseobacterium camelliae TaxID=1265445 RepID=A0ABU0TEZ6_9FLAO|nr:MULTISPECIES: voltage-gated chloride channel family protein [Chryseobacterium]MDT3406563.1 H+/Cl- antiporter ClcA [Pseudacidovorax intermedius]MDQ1095639.1 H+/Cl- antiporter ClcA [Chryseobacterium camelliae]MDQ1099576.1 H+/Cl- antiporter ClcA [Chryseobacterium sp. SORGH_AS_1048]MDR6086923.1 H+/Cl- antiporter ClcA [Chryseobacterium sp. SORGH_AS_0909]MDR6131296.1 H+/Cl- antiporter ClcA [Chryseobacterium sp. SORGH_AS_1175]